MKQFVFSWMKKLGIPTKGLGFDFIKNTGFVTIASFFEQICSYLIIIMISRFLGAEGLGQYSFLFAFAGLFFIFADWGISSLSIQDLSSETKNVDNYISNLLSLKFILVFSSFIIYFISLFFINKAPLMIGLIFAGLVVSINQLTALPHSIARFYNKSSILAISTIIERTLALILAFIFIFYLNNLTLFVIGLFISYSVRAFILFLYSKNIFKFSFVYLNWSKIRSILVRGFPFLLVAIFASVYVQMDSVMLSFMKGDLITGLYNAPYKLINVLNIVPILLLTFGFPLFSKLYLKNKKESFKLLKNISLFSLIVIIPLIFLVFFFGDWVLNFIYGFNHLESFIAFKILIVAELFVFLTTIIGQFIAAIGKQKLFAKIAGFGAGVNITLNFILIPKFSLYGAAFATLFTYIFMFVWMLFFLHRVQT